MEVSVPKLLNGEAALGDPQAQDRSGPHHRGDRRGAYRFDIVTDRGEEATFYQGFDDRGREIEVIVVSGEGFDLVIHAMPVDYRRRSR